MAKATEKPGASSAAEEAPAKGGMKRWLLLGVVGAVAAGIGFAVPQFLVRGASESRKTESHNAGSHESESKHEPSGAQPVFIPFGELVVNLAEERLTRYLRVSITLQVESANEQTVKQGMEKKKANLKNWLISYLSDKTLDDVRGAAGVNRARREIQDQFNIRLFPDGSEIVRDVLFEEFSVQ